MTAPLRVLVTGSRAWTDRQLIADVLLDCWHDALQLGADGIVVVHGVARGADMLADDWAAANGHAPERHPAGWERCAPDCPAGHRVSRGGREFCPTAGTRRNALMVGLGAAVCVAFRADDASTGTAHCAGLAEGAGIPVRRFGRWAA